LVTHNENANIQVDVIRSATASLVKQIEITSNLKKEASTSWMNQIISQECIHVVPDIHISDKGILGWQCTYKPAKVKSNI